MDKRLSHTYIYYKCIYTTSVGVVNGTSEEQPTAVRPTSLPRFDEMTWNLLEVECSFATATRLQVFEKPQKDTVVIGKSTCWFLITWRLEDSSSRWSHYIPHQLVCTPLSYPNKMGRHSETLFQEDAREVERQSRIVTRDIIVCVSNIRWIKKLGGHQIHHFFPMKNKKNNPHSFTLW